MMGQALKALHVHTVIVYLGITAIVIGGTACSNGKGGEAGAPIPAPAATPTPTKTDEPVSPSKGGEAPKGQDGEAPKGPGDEKPKRPEGSADPKRPSEVPAQNPEADAAITPMPNKLKYEAGVLSERKAALDEAISVLYALAFKTDDPALRKIMKMQTVAPADLQNWLEARVRYVVDEDFSIMSAVYQVRSDFKYPYSKSLPNAEQGLTQTASSTVMSNLGSAVYFAGKRHAKLLGVHLGGEIGDIRMTSPRVGLLKIGGGLFPELGENITKQNLWLDIYRAGTLFHEARHSDGRGKTLSFMHAKCPDNSDYAGMSACDFAANGPYTIGARVQLNLMKNCAQCSERSKSVLQMIYLDFSSRILKGRVKIRTHNPPVFVAKPVDWDDTPEQAR